MPRDVALRVCVQGGGGIGVRLRHPKGGECRLVRRAHVPWSAHAQCARVRARARVLSVCLCVYVCVRVCVCVCVCSSRQAGFRV